jgi:hypothetical protein
MSTVTNAPVVEAKAAKKSGAASRLLAGVKKLYTPRHAKVRCHIVGAWPQQHVK